jgi:hypothetical protein
MKVLDLQCAHGHRFEGWFGSELDFAEQLERGLLTCPMCGDAGIRKMLSAPRLNLTSTRDDGAGAGAAPLAADERQQWEGLSKVEPTPAEQARWLNALREAYAQAEDVGDRFADEARAMHQGEIDSRSIRGRASAEEAMALAEEGVDLLPLPLMPLLKKTLQ